LLTGYAGGKATDFVAPVTFFLGKVGQQSCLALVAKPDHRLIVSFPLLAPAPLGAISF
jgi:hypothetical protein